MNSLVSIITPFYNSEHYIESAIQSVLEQTYTNWELLLIDDGSTDQSKEIALSYSDLRIRYFEQENKGVSAARNVGLENMKGDFFCFLDSDDIFPKESLYSRYDVFTRHPRLQFVDGRVKKFDHGMNQILNEWQPNYTGSPLLDLVNLTGKSFLGLTWMIKREEKKRYKFQESLTHSEDLLFFMELSKDSGEYAYTDQTILHYRDTPNSAMNNLKGLENGYRYIESVIKKWKEVDNVSLNNYQYHYRRAMFLAYLRALQPISAFKSIF